MPPWMQARSCIVLSAVHLRDVTYAPWRRIQHRAAPSAGRRALVQDADPREVRRQQKTRYRWKGKKKETKPMNAGQGYGPADPFLASGAQQPIHG